MGDDKPPPRPPSPPSTTGHPVILDDGKHTLPVHTTVDPGRDSSYRILKNRKYMRYPPSTESNLVAES